MPSDRVVGVVLILVSLLVIAVYSVLLWAPPDIEVPGEKLDMFVVKLTVWTAVAVVFGVLAWIGYTLATTSPPKPLEKVEREIREELERLRAGSATGKGRSRDSGRGPGAWG